MLGILCGLQSEAKIARRISGALVACAAARPFKARELARELISSGATSLMSFGIAGSLDPSVHLGDLVVGTSVISPKGQWGCEPGWVHELHMKLPGAKMGAVYGSETLVATAHAKQKLRQDAGCVIVDMESQCAAEIAEEAGVPLIVVRAVCDDSHMDVPDVVMAAIAEDGSIRVMKAITSLAQRPSQFVDLFHVIGGTGKALKALKQARPSL